jgi:uncharacterized coiled-coil DUF342 family protein
MQMQAEQFKERISQIEACVDEAKDAVQQGQVPPELRQSVETLHQQARQVKQQVQASGGQQQMGQDQIRQAVEQLEQSGDRAVQACRRAGNVDRQTQLAVQRAHDEISNLKKQVQMG